MAMGFTSSAWRETVVFFLLIAVAASHCRAAKLKAVPILAYAKKTVVVAAADSRLHDWLDIVVAFDLH
jgi:hypothetical protein